MSRSRIAVLWSVASLLTVLVGATLLLLFQPVIFTGRYYELTIRSVEFGPHGLVSLTYDDAISYGTSAAMRFSSVARGTEAFLQTWDRKPPSFLRWPRKDRSKVFGFWITTDEDRAKGISDSQAVRQRLLLKEGTYHIREGAPMTFYRRQEPDGNEVQWTIEVRSSP